MQTTHSQTAQVADQCLACGELYARGEEICRVEGLWVHAACASRTPKAPVETDPTMGRGGDQHDES